MQRNMEVLLSANPLVTRLYAYRSISLLHFSPREGALKSVPTDITFLSFNNLTP